MTTRLPGIRAISIATGAALLLGLALTTAPAAHAAGSPRALIVKQGMGTKGKRSVRVRAVQHALQRHGFRVHRADGRFGRLNCRTKVPGPNVRTRTRVKSVDLSAARTNVYVAVNYDWRRTEGAISREGPPHCPRVGIARS